MMWLCIYVFAVFAGVVSGDSQCFTEQMQICQAEVTSNAGVSPEPCTVVPKLGQCMEYAAKTCSVVTDGLKEFVAALNDICTPGTEMNKHYLEHKDCILNKAVPTFEPCMEKFTEEVKHVRIPTTQKELEELKKKMSKLICRELPGIVDCSLGKVNQQCTAEAESFLKNVTTPYMMMLNVGCKGVSFTVNAYLFIFQLFVVMLSLKGFL